MKNKSEFVRFYFYKSPQLKEPKNKKFRFKYGQCKSTLGLSVLGFYFDLPFSSSFIEASKIQSIDDFLITKNQRDMFNCGIDCGVKLYSLVYGKRMPDLDCIYMKWPDGSICLLPFSLVSLLGEGKYKFNNLFVTKRIANNILTFRKKDKERNVILNSIISSAFETISYSKFSRIFPSIDPFVKLKDGKIGNNGDMSGIHELHKKYYDCFEIKDSYRKSSDEAKRICVWLVEQAFSFIGKLSLNDFNSIIKNKEDVDSNPFLLKGIETYKEKNTLFSCTPMALILTYAPYRFRCDFFHGNEPTQLHTTNTSDFLKGLCVFSQFLLCEIENGFVEYLQQNI